VDGEKRSGFLKGFQLKQIKYAVTFDPQDIEAGHLNRAWSKLVKGLSE